MDERQGNFIAAWRIYRKMTQEELAASLDPPTTKGTISLYESGARKPSLDRLEDMARVLGTSRGALLDAPPDGAGISNVIQIWEHIPVKDRAHAFDVLKVFSKKKSGD